MCSDLLGHFQPAAILQVGGNSSRSKCMISNLKSLYECWPPLPVYGSSDKHPPESSAGGAAVGMKVEDYFVQGRRGWIRLHEKGGKRHDVPANHNLDEYLEKYIEQAGIKDDPKGPLFRTVFGRTDKLQRELKDVKKVPAYQRVLQFTRRRAARIFI